LVLGPTVHAPRDAVRAYWIAVAMGGLSILVTALMLVSWRDLPKRPLRDLQVAALLVAVAALVVLWTSRRTPTKRLGLAAFIAVLAPVCAYFWFNDSARAAQGVCWVPFEGNKVGLLTIGLLAPPSLAVGLLTMGAFTASALVHLALLPASAHASMAAGEPWTTAAYAGVGVGLFVYRLHTIELADTARRAQAEANLMQEVALISLAIRDLANTPVQTLEMLRSLLRRPGADLPAIERRMGRIVDRLSELNHVLSHYESSARRLEGEFALDSLNLIKKRLSRNPPP
jgi:hypothetical protein